MAMPTRILIKVNLILIQYCARKERERGVGRWGDGEWGVGGDTGDAGDEGVWGD
jgi:hypothetical protein